MGYTQALGMAEAVAENAVNLDAALSWHLQSNHYPPVPSSMVAPCKRAITYARKGEWDRNVRLPEGVTWRGKRSAPAHAVVEGHHLEAFI